VNVLLLLVGDADQRDLRDGVAALHPSRVHVVAPTVVGAVAWLATAEDDAHRRAEVRALEAEWTLADDAATGGEAGDADPVQAVEDALSRFPADAIVVAGEAADPDLETALRRIGLPVTRLAGASPRRRSRGVRALRRLAGGHGGETPFVLFVGVNAALVLASVALSLLVLLILWLSGVL